MLKSFSAMILAAGYGKRMLPLTKEIPKPLIKINSVSLLKNSIDFLYKIGCKNIVINTHYKHNLISEFIQEISINYNIKISYEKNILDTAGGVKNAMRLFDDENIIVTNSDVFWKKENEADVVENQVKMKLDLEYVMTELKKIKKDLKESNKTDKKIMKQHDQIFDLLENNSNTPSNYSYGD